MIVGIDPGKKGAIAFLNPADMSLTVHDMPTVPDGKSKTSVSLNSKGLFDLLKPEFPEQRNLAGIEKVHSMPGEGVSSAFTFGSICGAIDMATIAHNYEQIFISPQKWKKYFGITADKTIARQLAIQRFPKYSQLFARVKDDGRAEATLIALYIYENYFKGNP